MAGKNPSVAQGGYGGASTQSQVAPAGAGSISEQVIRRHYRNIPISVYRIKDRLIRLASSSSFLDAMLVPIAFAAVNIALNFYPPVVWIALLLVLFIITLFSPFLGLLVLTAATFPPFAYQTPVLAWSFLIIAAAILIYGRMHYRVAVFTYLLTWLSFSPLGYVLGIPFFIYAVLTIGNKRALITLALVFILVISFSGITGLQNSTYIAYDGQFAHSQLPPGTILALDAPTKPPLTLSNLGAGINSTLSSFIGYQVTSQVPNVMGEVFLPLLINPTVYLGQLVVLALLVLAVDWYAVNSRSKYKGAIASLFGVAYPVSYALFAGSLGLASNSMLMTAAISFAIAPAAFYIMEYYNISTVRSLEVRKQDIRMKFGEAFEDLEAGSTTESFADIGNYEATKRELRDAIITPIEERGIARAYNVNPAKGILFFGPPGTGKTMMMRALANEIHAGFYYVKASNLVSSYAGETERMLANIFNVAKKNSPCVLFFDEIDALAVSRTSSVVDETHRQALSQLLVEIDGFQKASSVILVGATNRPDMIDSALLRPGRFDKLIYMPLPDKEGRKAIFRIYLSKLPVARDLDIDEICEKTERFSGADIKGICENVAQLIAQEATREHRVLEITEADLLKAIKGFKPSTSMAQIETYRKFKLDYERSTFKEHEEEDAKKVGMDDVVGLDEVKRDLSDAIDIPLLHPDLMKKYGLRPINGVLMYGPPGNGKTMLMRAVASSMKNVTVLEFSGAQLAEEGIERAMATIKEIFNRAKENAPAVLMIDEIDGVLPSREGSSETSVQITTQMLKEIDGMKDLSNVVLVGATNRPDIIDSALLRPGRFDKLVYVRPPNPAERVAIIRLYLKGLQVSANVDYDKLGAATKGFSGADIAALCREIKTAALKGEVESGRQTVVSMEDIMSALGGVKPSITQDELNVYLKFQAKYGKR